MRITRIGGPTVFVELGGWRILVDPTFDAAGGRYAFAFGTSSVKTRGPALPPAALAPVDVVLLSHDHHADNLDGAGRALLAGVGHVVTTRSGAARLRGDTVRGLRAGGSTLLESPGRESLRVTATPCRHGPPLSRLVVGEVIGFAVRRVSHEVTDLWVTGDTVATRALTRTARGLDVDVVVVNAGGARFSRTGPVEYTMTGRDAVALVEVLRPRVAVAAHYDGWSHFRDGEAGMRAAVAAAPDDVGSRFRWLPDGRAVDLSPPTPHDAPPDPPLTDRKDIS